MNYCIKENNFDLLSKEQMEFNSFTIMNRTLIIKKIKSANFDKYDFMKEGIMKATQQLSNNMMQSVAIHQKKLENQFLLRTRAGKSFENEMNLIKKFNNNKLEKPNIETINNRRNNRKSYLSEAQVDLNKPKKNISPININNFNIYFSNNQIDINNNNNIQPHPQNQNIINIGKGGFGRVKQVLSSKDKKFYAIKEIPVKEDTKEQIQSFQKEINNLSQFNCNNIVKYYD